MSLDLAEIFLKSYSKCLLMCFSTRTLGKIHKVGFRGLSGGKIALFWAILTHICPFFEIFCLFLQFSMLESCYIWFTISLEYFSPYVYSNCPGKFKIRVCQGVSGGTKTPFWAVFAYFLRFFVFFFSFLHWNHVIFGLQLV